MYDAACDCYADHFDEAEAKAHADLWLKNPDVLMFRGENGFVVASITRLFYRKKHECFIVFLCARPNKTLEGYRLLKTVIQSARERGATKIYMGTDTGFDFAPFAARLGWETQPPTFALSL